MLRYKMSSTNRHNKHRAKNVLSGNIDSLKPKNIRIKTDLKKNYRRARKFVRAHPAVGIAIAFVGGVVMGSLLSRSK